MKRYFLLVVLLILGVFDAIQAKCSSCNSSCDDCKVVKVSEPCDPCGCVVNSRTHFSVRPSYQVGSPELESIFQHKTFSLENEHGGSFQATVFGGRSTDEGTLATYFSPFCQTELRVKEAIPQENNGWDDNDVDVYSRFFNVITKNEDFESIIRFAPQQSVVGLGLNFKQRFAQGEDGRAFWASVSMPITRVKNTMGFSEEVVEGKDGGGALLEGETFASMTEAFSSTTWECGRIDCNCEDSKTRLGDISFLVGYESIRTEKCNLESYIGALIPTGNAVTSEYLFAPIVGHAKHPGAMIGSNGQMCLWEGEGSDHLWFRFQIHGLYLFKKEERRLIDIVNKPWSRFMYVYRNQEDAEAQLANTSEVTATPGVIVFCLCVDVKPGFQRTYHTSLVYNRDAFVGEFGYTFFCRPAECVELSCPWKETPALRAVRELPAINKVQMINDVFGGRNDYDPKNSFESNVITECDLDLRSAAHPCMTTHTFYATLGRNWDDRDYPLFAALGGSYEYSQDNAGLSRWNLWAKSGVAW